MKKTVLVCGLISGLIISAMMVYSTSKYCATGDFNHGMVYGYAAMLLAFSLIFVGIKSYRDRYNNGTVTFGKAFQVGLYIVLICSTFYVATWMIESHFFFPDFGDKYAAAMLKSAKESGMSAAQLAEKTAQMDKFKEMYKNPLFVIMMTYIEILPVGLLVALIAALILKRKQKPQVVA